MFGKVGTSSAVKTPAGNSRDTKNSATNNSTRKSGMPAEARTLNTEGRHKNTDAVETSGIRASAGTLAKLGKPTRAGRPTYIMQGCNYSNTRGASSSRDFSNIKDARKSTTNKQENGAKNP
jgi:hypothetical protein